MQHSPFVYNLPTEKIAQRPVYPYDSAKLLVIDRAKNKMTSTYFSEICEFLDPKDLLLFNNSAVLPARIYAQKRVTAAQGELLFLESSKDSLAKVLAKPIKRFTDQSIFDLVQGYSIKVISRLSAKELQVECYKDNLPVASEDLLRSLGVMPIPPYIRNGRGDQQDLKDYQSIFAKESGSIAAPTASLHFTPELIDKILNYQVTIEQLTLHVGAASFLPLWSEEAVPDLSTLTPGLEYYYHKPEILDLIKKKRQASGRVIPVGTTVVRALESIAQVENKNEFDVKPGWQATEIFIKPGYKFLAMDGLVTNFHQPGTTHLLLVEALLGRALLEDAYNFALENNYRFLSYGDGMLIL